METAAFPDEQLLTLFARLQISLKQRVRLPGQTITELFWI